MSHAVALYDGTTALTAAKALTAVLAQSELCHFLGLRFLELSWNNCCKRRAKDNYRQRYSSGHCHRRPQICHRCQHDRHVTLVGLSSNTNPTVTLTAGSGLTGVNYHYTLASVANASESTLASAGVLVTH